MIIFLATVELRPAESVPRSPCGNSPGLLYGDLDDTRPTDSLVRNKLGGGGGIFEFEADRRFFFEFCYLLDRRVGNGYYILSN